MEKRYEDRSFWQKILFSKMHKGKFDYLEFTDTTATMVTHSIFKPKENAVTLNLAEIFFFDHYKDKVSFGSNEIINFKGLKEKESQEIRDFVMSNAPFFRQFKDDNPTVEKYSICGRSFKQWFFSLFNKEKEEVMVSALGMFHTRTSKKNSRVSFVPYDKIDYAGFTKNGRKYRLFTSGSLNFYTKYYLKKGSVNGIKDALSKYVKFMDGRSFKPCLFSGVEKRGSYNLTITDHNVVFTHGDDVKIINKVTSFKCKPVFSLFKRVAYIEGESEVDMRTGTYGHVKIQFPGVFFFTWGSIKSELKNLK